MRHSLRNLGAPAAVAYVLMSAAGVHAQEAESPGEAETTSQEIIVTAQRRSESVQSIPLAVSAISGDLQSKGVTSVSDLTGLAPSLQIQTNTNAINVSIRGITTNSVNIVSDTAIAYGYNGIPVLHSVALPLGLYDLERIEVLRGPQGTLYGRSATGGALNFIPARPRFATEASASATFGNYDLLDLGAMVNVAISQSAAIRAVVQRTRHDGYLADNFNNQNDWSARLSFLAEPTDALSIYISGDYGRREGKGSRLTSCPPGSAAAADPIPGVITNYCANFAWDPYNGGPFDTHSELNHDNNEIWGVSAEVAYDLGPAALTYIPSYRVVYQDNYTLSTSTYQSPLTAGDYVHVGSQIFDDWNKLQTHELRLASDSSTKFTWVAGAIYLDDRLKDFRNSVSNLPINGPLPVTGIRAFSQERKYLETKSYAVYGQVTYPVLDWLRLTGGLRYTWDKKTSRGQTNVINADSSVTVVPGDGDLKYEKATYRLGIDANVAPHSMVYATVSTGYKAGGFNPGIQPNLFAPETITSYEIGTKNEFFDRRLTLNVTGFYYDYSDYQFQFFGAIQVPNPSGGAPLTLRQSVTAPAEKVRVKGIELESSFRVTTTTTLSFNATYMNAEFTKFVYNNVDYSGNPLPFAPKWTLTGTLEQSILLGSAGNIDLRINSLFNSNQQAYYYAAPGSLQKSFTRTEASISYSPSNDRFRVTGWIRNIEGDAQITQYLEQSPYNPTQAMVTQPRTFGVTLDSRF